MRRPPPSQAAHRSRRSIAPGKPQRHRGHRARFRRNHEDTKNTKERNLRRRGRPEWSGGNAGDPMIAASRDEARLFRTQAFVPDDLRPGRRAARVGPAVVVPARTRDSDQRERRGLRSPRARAGGVSRCYERSRSGQRLGPAVLGRPAAGTSPVIELLCDSFVSLCLRGCDVGGWLCAVSVSLCLCGFAGCDGSAVSPNGCAASTPLRSSRDRAAGIQN